MTKKHFDTGVYLISYNLKTIRLNKKQPITIGREKYNDVVLNDLLVSRQHAMITWGKDGFIIKDLKSRNGTFLNNNRIETAALADGDTIKIGSYEFTIRTASQMDVEKRLLQERGRRASQETMIDSDLGIRFSEKGFSGDLSTLALVEVVQTLAQCLKTGKLSIIQEGDPGRTGIIYFENGEIIHAEHLGRKGYQAVISVLKLSEGQFDFQDDIQPPERTISDSTMGILMEACRLKDEEHRQRTQS